MDKARVLELEYRRTQELLKENEELVESNLGFLASSMMDMIHKQSLIESNIDHVFDGYNTLRKDGVCSKSVARILRRIKNAEYINDSNRYDILEKISKELRLENFNIQLFRDLSDERNAIAHAQLKLTITEDELPVIKFCTRKEGIIDIAEHSKIFNALYKESQKKLKEVFYAMGFKYIQLEGE